MKSYYQIYKVAYPIGITLLIQSLVQVIGTIFLSHVSEVDVGASALSGVFFIILFVLGFGFSLGAQILIGRRNGERNYGEIGTIVIHSFVFLLIFAAIVVPLVFILLRHFPDNLFKSVEVKNAAIDYMKWRIIGLLFIYPATVFRAFYVGIARTKILSVNALVLALINVTLDYGLILGHFGFPKIGIEGAGISASIGDLGSFLFLFLYTAKKVNLDLYKLKIKEFVFHLGMIKRILNLSIFMMVQYVLSNASWLLFFFFIEKLGERPLAISNIARNFYMLMIIPSQALGATTNTLVSNTIGEGKTNEVLSLIKRINVIGLVIIFFLVAILLAFPRYFLSFYSRDPSMIKSCIPVLYVMSASLFPFSIGMINFNAISGTGNPNLSLRIELYALVAYFAYIWYIVYELRMSVAFCFTSDILYWGITAIATVICLLRGRWRGKRI